MLPRVPQASMPMCGKLKNTYLSLPLPCARCAERCREKACAHAELERALCPCLGSFGSHHQRSMLLWAHEMLTCTDTYAVDMPDKTIQATLNNTSQHGSACANG